MLIYPDKNGRTPRKIRLLDPGQMSLNVKLWKDAEVTGALKDLEVRERVRLIAFEVEASEEFGVSVISATTSRLEVILQI